MTTTKVKKGFWDSKTNQLNCLKSIAKKFNIKEPHEWGKLQNTDIIANGGGTLLWKYKYSLMRLLKNVYSGKIKYFSNKNIDIQWKENWFRDKNTHSFGYWKNAKNKLEFFEDLSKKLSISKPSDWGLVSKQEFVKYGGIAIFNYYGSLFHALRSTYPNIEWKQEWFIRTRDYWRSNSNQRAWFDEAAKILKIKKPSDWGNVTIQQIEEMGGGSLIIYYQHSLYKALKGAYSGCELIGIKEIIKSDVQFKKEWFKNLPKYGRDHWKDETNHREFLFRLSWHLNIDMHDSNWNKVTISVVKKLGGQGLLNIYNGSIVQVIKSQFGNLESLTDFTFKRSNSQSELSGVLSSLFPDRKIVYNARKIPFLLNKY